MDVPHRSPAIYAASHTDAPHRNPASDTADLAQVEVVSPQPSLWSATLQYVNRYAWANENMTKEQAASMAESARYAKSYAVREINARKVSHNYSVGSPLRILFSWHGTFWPLVIWRYELYLYPIIHVGLIAFMGSKLEDDESLAEEDDLFWVKRYMVPWASLSLLTPLMIFFLVFFLSNCYSRFNSFFSTIQTIERSVQDLAMLMLSHVTDPSKQEMKWDAVRYLTASAMVIYSRVTKIGAGKDAQMNIEDWGRLLKRERDWQSEGGPALPQDIWERIVGWPRTRDQEANYQSMMHAAFADNPNVPDGHKIATEVPERRATCLPLLDATEVNRLRRYPGGMYSLVLCTWSMQTVVAAGLTGPALAASQSATMSMKSAAYELRNGLSMKVPMPYLHALNMLQNINFLLYSYALCDLESYLSPIVLFVVILITVGMREVAVALSNPFGRDDIDFPVNKWVVSQLRSIALIVHPDNFVVGCPKLATYAALSQASPRDTVAAEEVEPRMPAVYGSCYGQVPYSSSQEQDRVEAEETTPGEAEGDDGD